MKAINNLLANPNFIELDNLLNRFNVFVATDMLHREIKHTKFLSFLLDPNETHGCGDYFLRIFLTKLLLGVDDINLMGLQTDLTQIFPEWNNRRGNKEQIDIVLSIPIINSKKILLIAVENKINATQGDDQLPKYDSILNGAFSDEDFIVKKFYLTKYSETPDSVQWINILYSETVMPTVELLLKSKGDKVSSYLKSILEDYLHLMTDDEETDDDIQKLLQGIDRVSMDEVQKSRPTPTRSEPMSDWSSLWIRYPRACKQINDYDSDFRKPALNWWQSLNNKTLEFQSLSVNTSKDDLLKFSIETSNRKNFRFSLLTHDNAESLIEMSKGAKRKWLESNRNLAFEVYIVPIVKFNIAEEPEDTDKCNIWVNLVLGALNLTAQNRLDLVNSIKPLGWTRIKLKMREDATTTNIISSTTRAPWKAGEIDSNSEAIKNWISSNLFTITEGSTAKTFTLTLNVDLKKEAEALNASLRNWIVNRKREDNPNDPSASGS